jgi:hypothetical protein
MIKKEILLQKSVPKKSNLRFLVTVFPAVFMLTMTFLACQIDAGGPQPPRKITVSVDSSAKLEQILKSTFSADQKTGLYAFTLTEQQLTSYLTRQLSLQDPALITQPQILLQNGQVEIYGVVRQGDVSANARIVLKAEKTTHGSRLAAVSADLGTVKLNSGLDALTDLLNSLLDGSAVTAVTGFRVETIHIADQMITVTVRKL